MIWLCCARITIAPQPSLWTRMTNHPGKLFARITSANRLMAMEILHLESTNFNAAGCTFGTEVWLGVKMETNWRHHPPEMIKKSFEINCPCPWTLARISHFHYHHHHHHLLQRHPPQRNHWNPFISGRCQIPNMEKRCWSDATWVIWPSCFVKKRLSTSTWKWSYTYPSRRESMQLTTCSFGGRVEVFLFVALIYR